MRRIATLSVLVIAVLCSVSLAGPPYADAVARRLMREGKHEEAIREFANLIERNPNVGSYYNGLGFCLYPLKRYDEAIAAFQRAAELGQGPAGNMYNIACCYALSARPDQAIEWLGRAYDAGFTDDEKVEKDGDMDSLRADPRFIKLTGLNPPADKSRDEQWRYDLDFFARRMKQMHWNLYRVTPEQAFKSNLENLKADVPKLKDHQVLMRLMRITASVGDGHTLLQLRAPNAPQPSYWLPVMMYQFSEGVFVRAAAPEHKDLLGAKVLKIGKLDTAAALEAVKPYIAVDNAMGYLDSAPGWLTYARMLEAIGAVDSDVPTTVALEVQMPDGSRRTVELRPAVRDAGPDEKDPTRDWPRFIDTLPSPLPLYARKHESPLWREHLPEKKTLYVYFGGITDPPGSTFAEFFAETLDFIEKNDVERLVLDMRLNGGGNTGLVMPLIHGLIRCEKINQPGKLFVIIGRRTFSAAQNTVNMIESHTNATFVGEPTGSRPQFIGESTSFRLPYHRNRVYCSSRYWQVLVSTDKRTWVAPQIPAPPTFAAYAANRDPAMDAIDRAVADGWPISPTTRPASSATDGPASR